MTWAPLLLADPSPILRLRVLRDILGRPEDDPEVQELTALSLTDPVVTRLESLQDPDGSWRVSFTGDTAASTPVLATALALMRLGYFGFSANYSPVRRGAEYLFSQQRADGSWPQPAGPDEETGRETYSMRPLQTALPLRALAACGFAEDPRAGKAYTWLFNQRLPDGAWPVGIAAGNYGYIAGYRRLAHSRWGCRSNTTGALICLAYHPIHRDGPEARRALDLLLGRETREASQAGYEVARLVGAEPFHGFTTFYARFDLAMLLDLCWRVGASLADERVAALVAFISSLQGPFGLWEYASRPQVSRWLTLDLLRSLAGMSSNSGQEAEWVSFEPRTPFRPYPKKARRY